MTKPTKTQLYAVMGTEHLTHYGAHQQLAEDEQLVKRIVITDPALFRTGDAFLTAYCQHRQKLTRERAELEAQKEPIDKRLKEVQAELTAIYEYCKTIDHRLLATNADDIDPVVFVARDDYQYNGPEGPGSYRGIQQMIKRQDQWHIAYADEEHRSSSCKDV